MVLPDKRGNGVKGFKTLSVPLGFTPIMWNNLVDLGKVKVVSVKDAFAALQMVQKGRVDGADIEFHVAQHILLHTDKPNSLVLDPSLPYDIVDFHLSTIKHRGLLKLLNQFLSNNTEKIDAIKKRYGLRNPQKILTEAKSDSDK